MLVSPEAIDFQPDPAGSATVMGREFLGREWLYQVRQGELSLRLRLPLAREFPLGEKGRMGLRPASPARLFPAGLDLRVVG